MKNRISHILALIVITAICLNCGAKHANNSQTPFMTEKIPPTQWNDIFENHEIIPFTFNDPNMEIFTIGDLIRNSNGHYDELYDSQNNLVQYPKGWASTLFFKTQKILK